MPPHPELIYGVSCTVVGVGPGGTTSLLARIAVVNYEGNEVLDKYVIPTSPVTDYRTSQTGITEADLKWPKAWSMDRIQNYCANNFRGKILVGHCLWHDLSVIGLAHPAIDTRDVGLYQPFRNAMGAPNTVPRLPRLVHTLMLRSIQEHHIDAMENARAVIDLYRSDARAWETSLSSGNWPCAIPPSTFSRCYI